MPDIQALQDVVGQIYDASYCPKLWPKALEGIAEFTHSSSAILIHKDNELERASGIHTFNITDDEIALYNSHGYDPNFQIMSEHTPVGVAAAIDHIITDRNELNQIYGDEFLNILETVDTYHTGGVVLFVDDIRTVAIGVQRKKSMGAWTKPQIDTLNLLVPHLQRAMNIQKEFVRLQTREQALQNGLDKLLMGLVLFDNEIEPIYVNPVAKNILGYHPVIKMRNNKIYAENHSDTVKIHKALVKAVSSNVNLDPSQSSTSLGLKHPQYATTLPMLISPAQGVLHGFNTEGQYAHAVVCFSDPGRSHPIETERLADIYSLTLAEGKVAISIANGMSPDEIATQNNIAISTVRSQIKAIYNKLGINHQTELVKILLTGPFN